MKNVLLNSLQLAPVVLFTSFVSAIDTMTHQDFPTSYIKSAEDKTSRDEKPDDINSERFKNNVQRIDIDKIDADGCRDSFRQCNYDHDNRQREHN